jgi:hypothetical protein
MSVLELPALDQLAFTDEAVCHLYDYDGYAPISLCGVPRSEQPHHLTHSTQWAPFCAGCGMKRCKACRQLVLKRSY